MSANVSGLAEDTTVDALLTDMGAIEVIVLLTGDLVPVNVRGSVAPRVPEDAQVPGLMNLMVAVCHVPT
jgi:hypothetical protein